MLYIRPTQKGYEAYDIYHHFVFSEIDCEKLFAFLESNTGSLTEKLRSYFNKRIDADTLEAKEGKVSKAFCEGIKKEMEAIHPSLASDRYAVVYSMLAEELNSRLYQHDPNQSAAKETYSELLRHLLQPLITIGTEPLPPAVVPTSKEFAEKHYAQLEGLYQGKGHLSGLSYIENVRTEAERYLFWVLDQSSFRFKDLDRSTRVRLYSQVFRKSGIGADLHFVISFYWKEPEEYDYYAHTAAGRLLSDVESGISVAEASDRNALADRERQRRKKMTGYLSLLHSDRQQLTDELKEFIDDEIYTAREDTTSTLFEEYHVDSFYQLIQLQLWLLTKGDAIIKRCRHCDRLFIAARASVDYCSRVMDGEKEPCDIVGPKKSFSKLMDEDHVLKTYNRVYKTIYARMKRCSITAEEFNRWKAEARSMLDKTRAGEMSEEQFEAWLTQDIRAWGTVGKTEEAAEQPLRLGE